MTEHEEEGLSAAGLVAGCAMRAARFALGRVVGTPGAIEALEAAGVSAGELLARHVSGDWGDIEEDDAAENEIASEQRARVVSAYALPGGSRVWVITEGDRSRTTFLLPDEY